MGIWGRLGNVVKSYLNDSGSEVFKKSGSDSRSGPAWKTRDSDLDAAFEELDDFLNCGSQGSGEAGRSQAKQSPAAEQVVQEEVRKDFAELGLSPDASAAECKAAYKKLLKLHHPDRHAADSEATRKATEKPARINAAYNRLQEWQKKSP